MPATPAEMPAGQGLPGNGVLYIGNKGKLYHGSHGGMPQLMPAELHEETKSIAQTFDRSPGHYEEWVAACRGGKPPLAGFDYSGPLTETVLLGVLSLRAPGRKLLWDSKSLKVANAPELNQYIHSEYRKGWTL
jgi:hypothetical protein